MKISLNGFTCMRTFRLLSLIIICLFRRSVFANLDLGWSGQNLEGLYTYPEIRGTGGRTDCGIHVPVKSYVCDPDEIIEAKDVSFLNERIRNLTRVPGGKEKKLCKCQRDGQCIGENDKGETTTIGFIIAIAFAKRIYANERPPSKGETLKAAQRFCKQVMGRWALGDCGNSIIILVWEEQKFLYIHPAREAAKFITDAEKDAMTKKVDHLMSQSEYMKALKIVLDDFETEIRGYEESRTDVGFLSLVVSVAVAIVFVVVITGCVCAFRCCGNLRSEAESELDQNFESVDTMKPEKIKRGGSLRRSLTRSPKLTHQLSPSPKTPRRLDHIAPLIQTPTVHQGSVPPSNAASRLASVQSQQISIRTNMARLASPYYGGEDGHSMV